MLANQHNPYAIILFFICFLFVLFGITEVVWNPGQLILFLLFFVQHPQECRENKKLEGVFETLLA